MDEDKPAIRALKFWVEYESDPGKPNENKAVEYVEWVKIGVSNSAATVVKVSRLMANPEKNRPAAEEWAMLADAYEAWRKGEEPPETGTPMAAWPGATPALIEALKGLGVKTVEDFVRMPDHEVTKIRIPNIRHMWNTAGEFLKTREGSNQIEAALAERDAENAELQRQMAELKAQVAEMAPKKRLGRPPKAEAA